MANPDGLVAFDYDPRSTHYQYNQRLSWPMQQSDPHSSQTLKRSTSPMPVQSNNQSYQQTASHAAPAALMSQWNMTSQCPTSSYVLDTTPFPQQAYEPYGSTFQHSPIDYMPPHTSLEVSIEANLNAGLNMENSYLDPQGNIRQMQGNMNMTPMPYNWNELTDLMPYPTHGLPDINSAQHVFPVGSPSDAYLSENQLEVRSLSSSDNGWATIDFIRQNINAISNPEQTLHPRTFSDSSYSDVEQHSRNSGEYVEVPPFINSPSTDSIGDAEFYSDQAYYEVERPSPPVTHTTAFIHPVPTQQATSPTRAPTSPTSRRQARKNPPAKSGKAVARRSPPQVAKTETEKRVGRRKGPLRPEQRKQACEIRKLGACLRCKFLKKTCDIGEPCAGCQPSHARLWQVPCTRIDIKDIAYFMKDWKADYTRHVTLGVSVGNIKGFSDHERLLLITHGYGHVLPIQAREIYVRDERIFGLDWVEQAAQDKMDEFVVNTAKLSAGANGVSPQVLSDYLDQHIESGFDLFVNNYFEGTPFITGILITAYHYWLNARVPVIKKALKLVLAYNLTQHVTMVVGVPEEEGFEGLVRDPKSRWSGQTIAPVLINFQIKCAMADMWRELQRDILEELSSLYSSVYGKDKLKNWPTIFLLATILLAVWEEMQFDCHYRVPDVAAVDKFCTDMETTPVGVIVGLFQAISTKLPSFSEWDYRKHNMLLHSDPAVCEAMDEVKGHVLQHEKYLRTRAQATFDRNDFDSLSNKFVSKLVIRAN
ncbi:hypothetical protein MMC18_003971 [Xylographa bjoerkii]|nr:hypothetical protein [Xylographa bjoerkii]